jgi:chaperonin GroES
MNIRPLHDRVIVKRVEETESKRGMLFIPDSAKEKPHEGEVKAVGTGRLSEKGERVAMEVKPGDRILFGKYGGSEVKVDGEEWLVLREDEILAVLD